MAHAVLSNTGLRRGPSALLASMPAFEKVAMLQGILQQSTVRYGTVLYRRAQRVLDKVKQGTRQYSMYSIQCRFQGQCAQAALRARARKAAFLRPPDSLETSDSTEQDVSSASSGLPCCCKPPQRKWSEVRQGQPHASRVPFSVPALSWPFTCHEPLQCNLWCGLHTRILDRITRNGPPD